MELPMSTKVLMDVDEYLHTSFDGPDCEYLDGEVVERNMGELPARRRTGQPLSPHCKGCDQRLGIRVLRRSESASTRVAYRIPRHLRFGATTISASRIPTVPPFLAIEILSAEDRMTRILPKIQEYLAIGVEWVWVIDPEDKSALTFSRENPAGAVCDVLRTSNPDIEIPLAAAFDLDA